VVITAILAIVRSIRAIPGLVVKRAIKALRYTVLGEDVGIEEDAGLISTVYGWMSTTVPRLYIASIGACLWVIALALAERKVFVAHVCIPTL